MNYKVENGIIHCPNNLNITLVSELYLTSIIGKNKYRTLYAKNIQ